MKKLLENENRDLIKQSLLTIDKLKRQLKETEKKDTEPIAVVGMACRFPGKCDTPEEFWNLLKEGREGIVDVPDGRWDADEFYDPVPGSFGKMYVKQGNFIQHDISEFDAKFFKISSAEANSMDPQQRQLLEVSWEALENAGQNPLKLKGSRTGVFIGISSGCEYAKVPQDETKVNQYIGTGTLSSIAAGRISYVFGWNGPSLAIDTACSSSLVSTNLAVNSLRSGECDMALTGGVSLMISPIVMSSLCMMNAISADGRSKPFDANGKGYGRAEGCGILILKRLSDAQHDGDTIYALIRDGAVNNDGESSGITVPNGQAQQMVINRALEHSGIKPGEISYLEAHGTGTPLGDPIEFDTINKIYGNDRENRKDSPLVVGTVKGNIGHLEAAAGIASLIKVVLSLYKKEIPPLINHKELNSRIKLNKVPVTFPSELLPWDLNEGSERIAGINSFGFSGTNAHMILSEAPPKKKSNRKEQMLSSILLLSAKDEKALVELIRRYDNYFETHKDLNLINICYVSNACRMNYMNRAVFIGNTPQDMQKGFKKVLDKANLNETIYSNETSLLGSSMGNDRLKATRTLFDEPDSGKVYISKTDGLIKPKFAFLFSGDDKGILRFGAVLYEIFEVFQTELKYCMTLFEPYYGSFTNKLSDLNNTVMTANERSAFLFSIEYAFMRFMESVGIVPEITVGERTGNYIAAVLAGILSVESAVKHFMELQRITETEESIKFIRVFLDKEKIEEVLKKYEGAIVLSAVYTKNEVILSGKNEDFYRLAADLESSGVKYMEEDDSKWPSDLYKSKIAEYGEIIKSETYSNAKQRYVSVFSAESIKDSKLLKLDFAKQTLTEAVQYEDSVSYMYRQGYRFFIEIGSAPYRSESDQLVLGNDDVVYMNISGEKEILEGVLQDMAKIICLGAQLDWENFYKGYECEKVLLPNYPFAKTKHWITPPAVSDIAEYDLTALCNADALTGVELNLPMKQKQMRYVFTHKNFPELSDNSGVVHVGYFLEILERAMQKLYGGVRYSILNMEFMSPVIITEDEIKEFLLSLEPDDNGGITYCFHSKNADQKNWNLNGNGQLKVKGSGNTADMSLYSIDAVKAGCSEAFVQREEFYSLLETKRRFHFGRTVRWNEKIWYAKKEAFISFGNRLPLDTGTNYAAGLHPGIIDSLSQVCNFLSMNYTPEGKKYMVKTLENVVMDYPKSLDLSYGHVKILKFDEQNGVMQGNMQVMDEMGKAIISIGSIILKEFDEEKLGAIKALMDSTAYSGEGKDSRFLKGYLQADAEGRAELLTQYVRDILAHVLETDRETIDVDEDLDNYGLDSMAGVSFHNKLVQLLGIDISFVELIQCRNLTNIACRLLPVLPDGEMFGGKGFQTVDEVEADMSLEHWIFNYKPNTKAKIRVFCFPNGYRSADMYKEWQEKLGDDVDICAIQLPGLDIQRMNEKAPEDVDQFIDVLESVLSRSLFDLPCAAFGHSWGALFAYRLSYRLSKNPNVRFVKLFVSGFTSPTLPNSSISRILEVLSAQGYSRIPSYEEVKAETGLQELVIKAFEKAWDYDEELTKITLHLLLGACKLVDRYQYNPDEQFNIPIIGLHGVDDYVVTIDEMSAWENVTAGPFQLYTMAGDHQYVNKEQSEDQLLILLKDKLKDSINTYGATLL